jgi:glycosyltransferase involved in cell wall biosynthesis
MVSMKDPLVSARIITYNQAPYIARTIDGVLQQKTNFPVELVIGEDCSTDGTKEIVEEYQKNYSDRIRIITSEANVGMRTNGLRSGNACRGKYIAFCDGDDYWHDPDKLQRQVDYLENHPDCGLVYSSYDVVFSTSRRKISDYIKYRRWKMPDNPTVADFINGNRAVSGGILTSTIMLRKNIRDRLVESDPDLYQSTRFYRGDTQLWAEMAHLSRIHFISDSLVTYNVLTQSAGRTGNDFVKSSKIQISDADLCLYLDHKYGLPLELVQIHQTNLQNGHLRLAFYTRDAGLAEQTRRKKKSLTWKEWILYQGAKNSLIYRGGRIAISIRDLFVRENVWP